MKAIILAAGFGNRMRPLTNEIHKTLLKIGEETIIERIINGLKDNSIRRIIVVTGYKEEQLKSFLLEKYPDLDFQFINNERYKETNNIFSLALAFEKSIIDENIILIESDLIYEPKVIKKVIDSKYENVALVDRYRSGMDGTVVVVRTPENIITNVIPTHLQDENFDFSDKYKTLNIYKFSKDFCNDEFKKMLTYYVNAFDKNCYYELILGILIYMQRENVYAEILNNEKWAEIDDPNDLRIAEFIFCPPKKLKILETGFGGYWSYDILDFCFIRNMYFPNSSILSEIKNNLPKLLQNYGSKQDLLNEKLAYFLGYKKQNLQLLNGASQIYPILKLFFEDNIKILLPNPTFGEYTRIFKDYYTYYDKGNIDFNEILEKSKDVNMVIFVNPNNPTGSEIETELIYDFTKNNPQKIVIIDESFIDFSKFGSIISRLESNPLDNIIVIKSLSKSLGVPGVRLGYVYSSNKEFNEYLVKNIPIWNSNSIAEFMLEIILKHKVALIKSYKRTIEDREDFIRKLNQLSIIEKVYPSGANFVLVCLNFDLCDLRKNLLLNHSIYVKEIYNKFNDGKSYLRLAVRSSQENDYLIKLIEKYSMKRWWEIWSKDKIISKEIPLLQNLIYADGFDSAIGHIDEKDWDKYIEKIKEIINIDSALSIYEIGCGAGAFLYPFYSKGHKVGGIDYSESLLSIARNIMPNAKLVQDEAINLNIEEKYDIVFSNSVIFYFPSLLYAKSVIEKMCLKANKKVIILEIPDLAKKGECEKYRRSSIGLESYEKKYTGLNHIYFEKSWFEQIAREHNYDIIIKDQFIENYSNSKFRFNVFMTKREDKGCINK